MTKLSQLAKLREWFTIEDGARYLSLVFDEDISAADMLRTCLDGHLKLSVRFVNHAYAKIALPPPTPEKLAEIRRAIETRAEEVKAARAAGSPLPPPPDVSEGEPTQILILDSTSIYDLPLVGAERLDVEHLYQRLTRGPAVTLIDIDGTFVEAPDGRRLWLHERAPAEIQTTDGPVKISVDYIPTGGLPHDAVLVVRRSVLERFVASLSGDGRPVARRPRDNFLAVIGAACHLPKLDYYAEPTDVAKKLEAETERLGHRVAARTVLQHLLEVRKLVGNQ